MHGDLFSEIIKYIQTVPDMETYIDADMEEYKKRMEELKQLMSVRMQDFDAQKKLIREKSKEIQKLHRSIVAGSRRSRN